MQDYHSWLILLFYSQYLEIHFIFANIKSLFFSDFQQTNKGLCYFLLETMTEGIAWSNFLKHLYKEMTSNWRHQVLIDHGFVAAWHQHSATATASWCGKEMSVDENKFTVFYVMFLCFIFELVYEQINLWTYYIPWCPQ